MAKEEFEVIIWRKSLKRNRLTSTKEHHSQSLEDADYVAKGVYIREVIKALGINPSRLNLWGKQLKFNKETAPKIDNLSVIIIRIIDEKKEIVEVYGDENIRTYPRIKKPRV